MQIGDILYFVSRKAKGYDKRPKYHIYLFDCDWRNPDDDYGFLFINKSNAHGDGFEIRKADGYQLDLDVSYIGCTSAIGYSREELDVAAPVAKGRLRPEDVAALIEHVQNSKTLEGHYIAKICAALARLL